MRNCRCTVRVISAINVSCENHGLFCLYLTVEMNSLQAILVLFTPRIVTSTRCGTVIKRIIGAEGSMQEKWNHTILSPLGSVVDKSKRQKMSDANKKNRCHDSTPARLLPLLSSTLVATAPSDYNIVSPDPQFYGPSTRYRPPST